ncbi:hypothetical protein B0J18DRAFT_488543 [Chaetomium sp. MPI-SDFR-AT-0129]|nr:hypothetical protein B0J18DRAFT_488543 [Chaetomium sp. MPI-SDFR-AT-0129]
MSEPPNRHFYSPNETAHDSLLTVNALGPTYPHPDVVQTAWTDILRIYFPDRFPPGLTPPADFTNPSDPAAGTTRRTRYTVHWGSYRGPPEREAQQCDAQDNQSGIPPDRAPEDATIVVVQTTTTVAAAAAAAAAEPRSERVKRDILWVKCRVAGDGTPAGWRDALEEAVGRLRVAHPQRNVHLILAVGIRWMVFEWVPEKSQGSHGHGDGHGDGHSEVVKQLYIKAYSDDDGDRDTAGSPVHPYIRAVAGIGGVPYLASSLDSDRERGDRIDTTKAYSLDFWTLDRETRKPVNLAALQTLERCLGHIQAAAYGGGPNPSYLH